MLYKANLKQEEVLRKEHASLDGTKNLMQERRDELRDRLETIRKESSSIQEIIREQNKEVSTV